uniref:Putative non-structural protein n=1 Tax=Picornavirales Q_sR_OV_023 TaxID=2016075 RepID=A0A218NJU2_9VIRU|nr:putative non-structural protein [Picornavirales Q_sR_OV_023]
MYICEEWDTIKCFLRLMSCTGIPISVEEDTNRPCGCCDGFSNTTIVFKDFVITKTDSETRFAEGYTFGESYAINKTYQQLKLILSGDVETNPGPPTYSKLSEESREKQQQKRLNEMRRELDRLKKAQEKHNNFVQRQIELEKRDRKKKREMSSPRRRHAQVATGLIGNTMTKLKNDVVSACTNSNVLAETIKNTSYIGANVLLPGLGTAAATVVNGSKVTAAVDKLNPTMDLLQSLLKTLTDAVDSIRNVFSIPSGLDIIGILISLASIANCLKEKSLLLLTLHCTNLARQLGVSLDSLMSLVPNFSDVTVYFQAKEDKARVAESLVTDMLSTAKASPELLPFAGFLSFLCGAFSLCCTGVIPTPTDMTKHFGNVGRAATGFKALKDMFNWIFEYMSEIYYTTVYGISADEYRFMKSFPDLENLYAAVNIIEKFERNVIDSSAAISDQIITVHHQLNEYHYQATKQGARSSVHMVASLQRRMKDQHEWATHSSARCSTIRTQPVAMYLFGHPGVGKSVITEVIKARIFKKYLSDKCNSYETASFSRHASNEYWEGYSGQPIIILDDFGNVKDSMQNPVAEYEELEYMVNTAPYPLNMAELKSKGVTNFTSEFIIASSNQKFPEIKHLVDPGAVFRRFHVWADVTIDPAYGKPIGRDNQGYPYYSFDRAAVAAHKKIPVEDVSPLYTEHYRFTCYKVTHDKQTGNAEVHYLAGKKNLTFEQFWDYFVSENDRRKVDSVALANAIRQEAGIDTPAKPETELQILEKFDRIFHPEKFIEAIVSCDKVVVDSEKYVDAEQDETFGTLSHFFNETIKRMSIQKQFDDAKQKCSDALHNLWGSVRACIDSTSNSLLNVAQFILSCFSSFGQSCYNYLPSVPSSEILLSICSAAFALFGVWYTGLFHRDPSSVLDSWCQFNRAPTNATVPCSKCPACGLIEYPSIGNMLEHFVERTGQKPVRDAMLKQGLTREMLEDIREKVRREIKYPRLRTPRKCQIQLYTNQAEPAETYEEARKVMASMCLAGCEFCDDLEVTEWELDDDLSCIEAARDIWHTYARVAQRVYDTQPRPAAPRNYAQRTYETQPAKAPQRTFAQKVYQPGPKMAPQRRLAQGMVECKTEMHIGARKHAQRDLVQIEQTTQVLLNNSVWIQAVDGKGMCCRSNGVFLVGRTMITTAHTILNPPHIDPIEYLIIRNPYSTEPAIKIPIDQCQISQVKQMDGSLVDLALVSFPPVVPNRPKIISKFLNSNDIDLLKEGDLTFSGFYEINNKTIVQEKYPSSFSVSTKTTEYYLHKPGTCPKSDNLCKCPIRIGNHVEYDLETSSGMCGALLSITNRLIHTKLIGFHVAGGAGVLALGVLTTRQLLEQALKSHIETFGIPPSYLIDGRLPYSQSWVDPNYKVSLLDLGDCLNVGKAPSPAAPSSTQLGPSLIFDEVQQHIAKPAFLKPTVVEGEGVVDPMLKGIKKIMGGQTFVDPDLLEAAAHDVFQGLGKPPTLTGIVHSYEEAIVGVEGDPYKRPINRTTSPGYPYNLGNKSKGKTAWLGDGDEYIVDNPELKADVEKLIADSRQGIRGSAISIATLKDEKRPIAKVDAGKTRVFEACPQHLVIAIRQYFLDFAAHVMRNRIDNGIAVGINPYSLEWTKLAHHLQSKGNYMIAGDFSNFDGSLLMQVLVKIMEKINEWYGDGEENQLIRAALWEHICNADILVKGEVIRKTHSQPSGNPLTVIINSLFNGIVMRIAYMLLKREQGLPAVCDYRKYVAEIIYGDDDIKSVDCEIIDWFNQLTLTDALASFGLTYTDETKTGKILPFKPLEEVAFLKRKFVIQHDGTFRAPMDLENILEITNWIRGKAVRSATLENCEQAVMELSLHPQSVYEYWSSRIQEKLSEKGLLIIVPTYFEQMEMYYYNQNKYERLEYVPLW